MSASKGRDAFFGARNPVFAANGSPRRVRRQAPTAREDRRCYGRTEAEAADLVFLAGLRTGALALGFLIGMDQQRRFDWLASGMLLGAAITSIAKTK